MNSHCDIIIPVMTLWCIYDIITGFHCTLQWIWYYISLNITYFTGYHRYDINISRRAVVTSSLHSNVCHWIHWSAQWWCHNSHSDNIMPMISSEIWYENGFCETTIAYASESSGLCEIEWWCHELFWYHISLHHWISLDTTGFTGVCSDGTITTILTSYFTGCELQWNPVMTLQ